MPGSLDTLKVDSGLDRKVDQDAKILNVEDIVVSESDFSDDKLATYYKPREDYEGYHRFDPKAVWTEEEERVLVKKIDWRIMVWCCIMFVALQLDRGNISNALTDDFLTDLGLTTNDYNTGQTIFLVCFLLMELPSQLVSKKLGPDRWIPIQMTLWSIVAMSQSRINSRTSFFATRGLLGGLEGGFIPDIVLYLSYFYKGDELPIRLSYFWVSLTSTTVIGSFLAYGLLHLRGVNGWEGWRYLFLIEGLLTLIVGIVSFFYLPPSPTQTKGFLRGKGWFSEREEIIMVNRVLRDDPSKGDMNNRTAVGPRDLWRSLCDYDNWGLYLLGLLAYIPMSPPAGYLTLTLKNLGFGTFNSNLLTIPGSVLFMINNLLLAYFSKWVKERALTSMAGVLWALPLLIALETIATDTNPWIRYAILILLVGYPYCHPILVGWNSINSNTVRTRTVSAAVYNMMVQIGGIAASNIYRADDAPFYKRGNKVLIGICVFDIFLFLGVKLYYIQRNKYKARIWEAYTAEEKEHYLVTTKHKGNKRLDFQFHH
ncbi:major facilitator superfamily transporter [Umbelopsis sp. AD052]|nr:major facilitator superfamily transporter [Umbelopsis sp. AD052]